MALWMKQHTVLCRISAAIDPPDDMMRVPSGARGDLLVTDWAEPVLLLPKIEKLPTSFYVRLHLHV